MANFNLNKVQIAGRLTADPELRTLPSGVATTSFSVAINGRGKDAQAVYVDVVAWRQQAEFVAKYFKKGSSIYVEGSLNPRSWTDQNNVKHYKTEVVANEISFVDGRTDSGEAEASTEESAPVIEETVQESQKPKRTRKPKTDVEPTNDEAGELPF